MPGTEQRRAMKKWSAVLSTSLLPRTLQVRAESQLPTRCSFHFSPLKFPLLSIKELIKSSLKI